MVDGEPVDIGLVGDVAEVDPGAVDGLIAAGRIPVISTVARGADGVLHNVNADTAAAALAVALGRAKLVVLTDVAGLYADWPRHRRARDVVSEITATELERAAAGLEPGMVPKMEACLRAVRGGVPAAHVRRRPGAALGAAGGLHRRRRRNDGGAGPGMRRDRDRATSPPAGTR